MSESRYVRVTYDSARMNVTYRSHPAVCYNVGRVSYSSLLRCSSLSLSLCLFLARAINTRDVHDFLPLSLPRCTDGRNARRGRLTQSVFTQEDTARDPCKPSTRPWERGQEGSKGREILLYIETENSLPYARRGQTGRAEKPGMQVQLVLL